MASLQNPVLPSGGSSGGSGGGVWSPGVPGPPLVDGRERELRDRTHPALTAERDRPGDRERDMNPTSLRDRDRDWDTREQSRRKQLPPPTGPGIPPPPTPLAGPGTGAPPPLGPGVPPVIGAPIPGTLTILSHNIYSHCVIFTYYFFFYIQTTSTKFLPLQPREAASPPALTRDLKMSGMT